MHPQEGETRQQRRTREIEERRALVYREMGKGRWAVPFISTSVALLIAAGVVAGIALNQQPNSTPANPTAVTVDQRSLVPESSGSNLNLTINQREWEQAVRIGPQWGSLNETPTRERLDCFPALGGLCMGKSSPNFLVGINKPVNDLMLKETGAINPVRPLKMIFLEDWVQTEDGEYVLGVSGVRRTGNETDLVVSLKAVAWNTFNILGGQGLLNDPNVDEYFAGTASMIASVTTAHELAHVGKEARLLAPLSNPAPVAEMTHPQIYEFENRYRSLILEVVQRGNPEAGLLINVEPRDGFNLSEYRDQINLEAQQRGLTHPVRTG